jgi:hypothetical protein
MPRPFTDITNATASTTIKNGTIVVTTTFRGKYSTLNTFVKNTPTISAIASVYGNRFYNGIFVKTLS